MSGAWTNLFEETVDAAKAPASETGFRHTNGFFKPADGGHWVDVTNGVTHNFQQLGADSDWIYLRDDSRNLNLRLPSKGGWSAWQTGALNASGVWTNLFEETPAAPSSAPPRANLVCTSGAGSTCTAWSNGVTCTQGAAAGCVAWSNGIKCVEGAGAACRKWSNGVTCTEGAGMACRKWSNGSVCVKTGKEECVEYTLNGPF